MRTLHSIQLHMGTREELLPGFAPDFPYLSSRAEISRYAGRSVPWHWHRAVELFYMEEGTLEYYTPGQRMAFSAGTGGFVNSNVLHMTRAQSSEEPVNQLLHTFDPSLVAGERGSRIERQYVLPVTAASGLDLLALDPERPEEAGVLALIREAFRIPEGEPGYELRVRAAMSEIWLALLPLIPQSHRGQRQAGTDGKLKQMLTCIYEHYPEKLTVAQLAASAYLSQRECFRVFQENLQMTPAEYIRSYRVQMACRLLLETEETASAVGYACGLGSGSYFGKVFREAVGCTPLEYRRMWQDIDRIGR